ncbi:LANO_0E07074g1_1 [Lachancea nothofagi CBS 11611]|uniref:LANO_0E07074g1_1 n=1 Tax=Lachancea nothofagi CBS 11611 TaxID=1266666 RepID=A0A1G4JU98_9SACH|nr:LANO_0E07074g1_1 [Lachancea nothofagi CBS 11611]
MPNNSNHNTRIFDVYAGEAAMPAHMTDIMSHEQKVALDERVSAAAAAAAAATAADADHSNNEAEDQEEEDEGEFYDGDEDEEDNSSGTSLVNSGTGGAVRLGDLPVRSDPGFERGGSLPTARPARLNLSPAAAAALTNMDIWSVPVENAFLAALRVIPKKGTAKIKLKDRNYGRNELISVYIQHRVGEYRAKKQISSHIQVWKKSILNKVHNGSQITLYEEELLELIENGAAQTTENECAFHAIFTEILDGPMALQMRDSSVSTATSDSSDMRDHQHQHQHQQQQHHIILNAPGAVPVSAASMPGGHVYDPSQAARIPSGYAYANPAMPAGVPEPLTPLEYARRVYSNLRSYKCVPVNMHDYTYQHPESQVEGDNNQQTLQAAQQVATQQRQLIENMYVGQAYGPPPTSDLGPDHVDYPRYDLHAFVPPTAARPPEPPSEDRHSRSSIYPTRSDSSDNYLPGDSQT